MMNDIKRLAKTFDSIERLTDVAVGVALLSVIASIITMIVIVVAI